MHSIHNQLVQEFDVASAFLEAYTAVDGAHKTMAKWFYNTIKGQQLSVDEFRILDVLANDLARTAVECSRQLNVAPGAISKLMDQLVKRGYVQRWRDQQDRRVVLLQISDEGLEVYDVALKALSIKWEDMVYDVGANVRTLSNLLRQDVGIEE
jgi:DNA-binding MarR family transcriptional regulator